MNITEKYLDDQFTLLIPTFNRYHYLCRLLRFYKQIAVRFRIVILDSSSESMEASFLDEFKGFLDLEHRKFSSEINFLDKINSGVDSVQTPYLALCADDDYLVPSGAEAAVRFLEGHSLYGVAQGWYVYHSLDKRGRYIWKPCRARQRSMDVADVVTRFEKFYAGYGNPFYAVYRTDFAKRVWSEVCWATKDPFCGEMLMRGLSIILARIKVLPVFFSSREYCAFSPANEQTFSHSYGDPSKTSRIHESMARHLSLMGIQQEHAHRIIQKTHDAFLGRGYKKLRNKKIEESGCVYGQEGVRSFFRRMREKWFEMKFHVVILKSWREFDLIRENVLTANVDPRAMERTRRSLFNAHTPGGQK